MEKLKNKLTCRPKIKKKKNRQALIITSHLTRVPSQTRFFYFLKTLFIITFSIYFYTYKNYINKKANVYM